MPKSGHSYTTGKEGEKDSFQYLQERGYVCPTKQQRSLIQMVFKTQGILINKRGFDVVWAKDLEQLSDAGGCLPTLYEVKSCGVERGEKVSDKFKGLGFTLTNAEKENAETLGPKYRFIFVNVAKQSHLVRSLEDFFNSQSARIYPTWSVFITNDL